MEAVSNLRPWMAQSFIQCNCQGQEQSMTRCYKTCCPFLCSTSHSEKCIWHMRAFFFPELTYRQLSTWDMWEKDSSLAAISPHLLESQSKAWCVWLHVEPYTNIELWICQPLHTHKPKQLVFLRILLQLRMDSNRCKSKYMWNLTRISPSALCCQYSLWFEIN